MGLTLVEGKGKKREWAEGETGCNALSTKALADPTRTSEDQMALQSCPELYLRDWALMLLTFLQNPVIACRVPHGKGA